MDRRDDEPGQQPQDEMDDAEGSETEDESEGVKGKLAVKSKGKSRRKACEKPEGSDQKRQAFSKRKRGLILKSYQLYKLTDARVFVFIVNDKGSSWAYASPGFARTLSNQHLLQMREYAQLTGNQRMSTEIMPHPHTDAEDRRIDDRPSVVRANLRATEAAGIPGSGGSNPAAASGGGTAAPTASSGGRNPHSTTQGCNQQQPSDMPPPPPGAAGSMGAAAAAVAAAAAARRAAAVAAAAAAAVTQGVPSLGLGHGLPSGLVDAAHAAGDGPRLVGRPINNNNKVNYRVHLEDDGGYDDDGVMHDVGPGSAVAGAGGAVAGGGGGGGFLTLGPDSIITPSGHKLAAAVGIALPADAGMEGSRGDLDVRDMPPPGPRGGGGGGGGGGNAFGAGSLERAGYAAAALAGLQPPLGKQARLREVSGIDSGGPPQPPIPRSRRLEHAPPPPPPPPPPGSVPAIVPQQQQQRRGPGAVPNFGHDSPGGNGSGATDPGPHPQPGAARGQLVPQQHGQHTGMGGGGGGGGGVGVQLQSVHPGDEDMRHLSLGLSPPRRQQATTTAQQLQQQPVSSLVPPPPRSGQTSHGSGSFTTAYVLPGAFSYGQVVQGSDGQLYRVVRELDDGEAPLLDDPMNLDEGAARVLMSLPQAHGTQHMAATAMQGVGGEGGG
ncbi:MADS-box transcription factor, partial [Volvox africanus]